MTMKTSVRPGRQTMTSEEDAVIIDLPIMSTRHGGRGGTIVNVGSVAARLGSPGDLVHYAVSKGAIKSFTIGLAREVATEGVRVNCDHPGPFRTELHNALGGMPRLERMVANIPMRRAGEPEYVANAIAFLLLDESAFVTGASLTVSGGRWDVVPLTERKAEQC